jgi:hypothetical protein
MKTKESLKRSHLGGEGQAATLSSPRERIEFGND